MKIVKSLLFVSGLFLMSSTAMAQGREGMVDVVQVCSEMRFAFSSDADDCIKQLRGVNSLQESAVSICASQNFSSDKIDCLQIIKNKQYTNSEINFCRAKTFSSDKNSCLDDQGQVYSGGVSDSEKLDEARYLAVRLKREISNGQMLRALSTLDELLWILQ